MGMTREEVRKVIVVDLKNADLMAKVERMLLSPEVPVPVVRVISASFLT